MSWSQPTIRSISHTLPRTLRYATLSSTACHRRSHQPDKWNYNRISFMDSDNDHAHYERVAAQDLNQNTTPPRCVTMLVRDFIEDSLYNPNYGYFSNRATILNTLECGFDFNSLRDSAEFQEEVAKRYAAYGSDKQLWHTPTELFKVGSVSSSWFASR